VIQIERTEYFTTVLNCLYRVLLRKNMTDWKIEKYTIKAKSLKVHSAL